MTVSGCADVNPEQCASIVADDPQSCRNSDRREYMETNCPETCKLCGMNNKWVNEEVSISCQYLKCLRYTRYFKSSKGHKQKLLYFCMFTKKQSITEWFKGWWDIINIFWHEISSEQRGPNVTKFTYWPPYCKRWRFI